VSSLVEGNCHYALALATMAVISLIGLGAALRLPSDPAAATASPT
jgi:hypothetical protein